MVEGRYEIYGYNPSTGEEHLKHTQNNLITDYGLNYFGSGAKTKTSNSDWNINDCGVWLRDFPEPTVLLEEFPLKYLTAPLDEDFRTHFVYNHNRSPSTVDHKRFDDGENCYIETTIRYSFDQGAISGDMFGAYIGTANSYGSSAYINYRDPRMYPWLYNPKSTGATSIYDHAFSVFSALKFKNEEGESISIPVDPIEQIFINYTVRKYLPKYAAPKKFTFTTKQGTIHECKVKPRDWDSNYNGSSRSWSSYGYDSARTAFRKFSPNYSETSSGFVVYDGNGSSISDSNSNIWMSVRGYVPYSFTQGVGYGLNIHAFNKPIAYADFYNTMGSVRAYFDPPIPKDNTLATSFSMSWGWGREEDLVLGFDKISLTNPNFSEDLTGWSVEDPSNIVPLTENGFSVASLRTRNTSETISQEIDLSSKILENRRITIKYRAVGSRASVQSIVLDYKDVEGVVLGASTIDCSKNSISNIENTLFEKCIIPEEYFTAQTIEMKINLSTENSADAYISITGLEFLINDMSEIVG